MDTVNAPGQQWGIQIFNWTNFPYAVTRWENVHQSVLRKTNSKHAVAERLLIYLLTLLPSDDLLEDNTLTDELVKNHIIPGNDLYEIWIQQGPTQNVVLSLSLAREHDQQITVVNIDIDTTRPPGREFMYSHKTSYQDIAQVDNSVAPKVIKIFLSRNDA